MNNFFWEGAIFLPISCCLRKFTSV